MQQADFPLQSFAPAISAHSGTPAAQLTSTQLQPFPFGPTIVFSAFSGLNPKFARQIVAFLVVFIFIYAHVHCLATCCKLITPTAPAPPTTRDGSNRSQRAHCLLACKAAHACTQESTRKTRPRPSPIFREKFCFGARGEARRREKEKIICGSPSTDCLELGTSLFPLSIIPAPTPGGSNHSRRVLRLPALCLLRATQEARARHFQEPSRSGGEARRSERRRREGKRKTILQTGTACLDCKETFPCNHRPTRRRLDGADSFDTTETRWCLCSARDSEVES